MALNFPVTPNVDDTFTDGITTWIWDGTSWNVVSGGGISAEQPDAFKTFTADTGTTTADDENDSFAITGGTDIVTAITGDEVSISFNGAVGDPDQNLFSEIAADVGSISASIPTSTVTFEGGTNISTQVVGIH